MAFRLLLRRRVLLPALILVLVAGGVGGFFLWQHFRLPQPGSPRYDAYIEDFDVGTAALDVGKTEIADESLTRAIATIPQEPAGWANRGLLYLRTNRLDDAARDLGRAHQMAPENGDIEAMLGYLAEARGNLDQAAAHLRRAAALDPRNVVLFYKLAQLVQKQGGPENDAEHQRLLERILEIQPNNLFVLAERAQIALRRKDLAAFRDTLERFDRLAPGWSALARQHLADLEKASAGGLSRALQGKLFALRNVLLKEPGYQRSRNTIDPLSAQGDSLHHFLRLPPPRSTPADPDLELAFTPETVPGAAGKHSDVARVVWLTREGGPTAFVADGHEVRRADGAGQALPFPGGPRAVAPTRDGVVPLDWDNDFRMDLLLAGAGGLRFFHQENDGTFQDVTAKTGLPASVLHADYYGAWAADVDLDADLDLIVAPRAGPPALLRNNFDGTFTHLPIFPGVEGPRAFAWADLDNDGAPDAVLLDSQGHLHLFANERSGQFRDWPAPESSARFLALAVADLNDDGVFDLAALRADGVLVRISDRDKRQSWDVAELGRWAGVPGDVTPGQVRLLAADLDNNGTIDLLAAGPKGGRVWLADSRGAFQPAAEVAGSVFDMADFNADGRLDLLGLGEGGQPVRLLGRGARDYAWQAIKPRANDKAIGDERINSFAIGGEVEVRSGTLVIKQPIETPVVHFGLGDRRRPDLIRIVWPNGTFRAEFEMRPDTEVITLQRLKSSCPFLFTWDGQGMILVTDCLWSAALGLYINAQDRGGVAQTTDWVKIRGDQLVPRDGYYDVRIHANLWETHYYDHLALMVVDHPPGTEVFVDERFFLTPTTPKVHLTTPPRPVARARDDRGQDVTEVVRSVDGRYLDTCGRGLFQGVTRDHWVEVDLGEDAPRQGPVWLLATGWVHPTDSSINFALAQGKHDQPRSLVLEVPDGKGGWKVGRDNLGFPAGKNKTILLRLDAIEGQGVSRHFRLRTNMEIYWDALRYARGLDATRCVQRKLAPQRAELRYRGILEMTQANRSSPEVAHYDRVIYRGQYWRDLIGYYTRFGDVRELLEKIDDRYVIMNAGDEIAMRFEVPPGPAQGWKRDFVWVSDGWTKDGDLNTRFGKTVLPLPAHDQTSYDTPPGRLEDDPVYRRFPEDWVNYHTRYITPSAYERGLRAFRRPQP